MVKKMENVEVYINEDRLQKRIAELGAEISKYYKDEEVVVISVLNGSVMFTVDLIKHLGCPVNLKFVRASSYGVSARESSGSVSLNVDGISSDIKGRHVLIVEDIVDTGNTYSRLVEEISKHGPKEIRFASLLFKPARLEREVNIDYLAFEIADKFVIGYGLDLDGFYRELPFVGLYKGIS